MGRFVVDGAVQVAVAIQLNVLQPNVLDLVPVLEPNLCREGFLVLLRVLKAFPEISAGQAGFFHRPVHGLVGIFYVKH